jgi:iron complex transport system ATP-binding protein
MSILSVTALNVRIGGRPICTGLDLVLEPGRRWALLGGNGIGKTTLLHVLAGLRRAEAGRVALDGKELRDWDRRALARKVGILFQDSHDTFPASVLDAALAGRHPHLPFWAQEGREDIRIAGEALAAVELADMGARRVDTLSGGERRRLAIATLLVQNPQIWLLDEPSNHLDLRFQVRLLELVDERIAAADGSALLALHDVNLALRCCTDAALMIAHDDIIRGPVADVINEANLTRMYRHPVRCVDDADGRRVFVPE